MEAKIVVETKCTIITPKQQSDTLTRFRAFFKSVTYPDH